MRTRLKAAGGVQKIVDTFEEEVSIKRKSSSHSHKSSTEDEEIISTDLSMIEPFKKIPGRSYCSFTEIESNPLHGLDEDKFQAWLKKHQRNISMHFPTAELESDEDLEEEFEEEF